MRTVTVTAALIAVVLAFGPSSSGVATLAQTSQPSPSPGVPIFEVDAGWPKPLPDNWIIGNVGGIAVDARDHVWVLHRPGSLSADETAAATSPPTAQCCVPAPPVIEFDPAGNVVQAWGGPGDGYEWPEEEHGIFIDDGGSVWISGSGRSDAHILKFTRTGEFLLQIGRQGRSDGSNDTEDMGRPAQMRLDAAAGEIYVADGHGNRRVVVFDAATGAYKRHWGAYGDRPDDAVVVRYDPQAPPPRQFGGSGSVHCIRIARDGLVYVCDRSNDRLQIFRKDGTFVTEAFVAGETLGLGTVADLDFSPDQTLLYVADGTNQKVWILRRDTLQTIGSFGRHGRNAGQFHWIHALAVDSNGNIYTGEANEGKRAQKFVFKGAR